MWYVQVFVKPCTVWISTLLHRLASSNIPTRLPRRSQRKRNGFTPFESRNLELLVKLSPTWTKQTKIQTHEGHIWGLNHSSLTCVCLSLSNSKIQQERTVSCLSVTTDLSDVSWFSSMTKRRSQNKIEQRQLKNVEQGLTQTVPNRGAELLTPTGYTIGWWKEHLKDLLTEMLSMQEAELDDSGEVWTTSLEETSMELGKLLIVKTLGIDELLKALDIVWLSYGDQGQCLWIVFLIFTKESRTVCSNYWGITWRNTWGVAGVHTSTLHGYFVDLEKTYDHVLWGTLGVVLKKYGVLGPLLFC